MDLVREFRKFYGMKLKIFPMNLARRKILIFPKNFKTIEEINRNIHGSCQEKDPQLLTRDNLIPHVSNF
jgi:hypothetical protein